MPFGSDFWVDTVKGESIIRPWDVLQLGPIVFPGIARVTAESPEKKVDSPIVQTNIYNTKAFPTFKTRLAYRGFQPAKIRAIVSVWKKDQWEDLKDKIAAVMPDTSVQTEEVWDITHPSCALVGVSSVIVTKVSVPEIIEQTLNVTIDMLQWFERFVYPVKHSSGGKQIDGPAPEVKPSP